MHFWLVLRFCWCKSIGCSRTCVRSQIVCAWKEFSWRWLQMFAFVSLHSFALTLFSSSCSVHDNWTENFRFLPCLDSNGTMAWLRVRVFAAPSFFSVFSTWKEKRDYISLLLRGRVWSICDTALCSQNGRLFYLKSCIFLACLACMMNANFGQARKLRTATKNNGIILN